LSALSGIRDPNMINLIDKGPFVSWSLCAIASTISWRGFSIDFWLKPTLAGDLYRNCFERVLPLLSTLQSSAVSILVIERKDFVASIE
jgi:hypothetical protein